MRLDMDYNSKVQAIGFLSNHPGAREALVDVVYARFRPDDIPHETLIALTAAGMIVWDAGKPKGLLKRGPSWQLDKNGYAVLSVLRKVEDSRKWKTERDAC